MTTPAKVQDPHALRRLAALLAPALAAKEKAGRAGTRPATTADTAKRVAAVSNGDTADDPLGQPRAA
jgi:hypothetical protein